METFSALLAICAGNSPVPGEFPTQRPVTRSFDVFFDLRPNKWLSKQSQGWWFETTSGPLWRHCNGKYWTTRRNTMTVAPTMAVVQHTASSHPNLFLHLSRDVEISFKVPCVSLGVHTIIKNDQQGHKIGIYHTIWHFGDINVVP